MTRPTPFPPNNAPKNVQAQTQGNNQVQLDLSLGKDLTCDNCQNYTFVEVNLIKYFSELVSPTGKAGNLPIPTYACNHCGHVNDAFVPAGYFGGKPNTTGVQVPADAPAAQPSTSTRSKIEVVK
jgi:hypothetical protein